ncbi:MAG: class I SAM-dependent methyltransferase [Chloroflexota bacterium]|nr:class I SAM-dependent methyltransferase [Chloroflexota bacterium]
MSHSCRFCQAPLNNHVIDLGHQPPSNAYLTRDELELPEKTYPLKVYVCTKCWLVQLPAHNTSEELFTSDYAYFSSTSESWCQHAKIFVDGAISRLGLGTKSLVIEIASNDGYLLQYMKERQIPCLGIEPTHKTAEAARKKGIETVEEFFNTKLASKLPSADLVIANNVLAHVPDIKDFLNGISDILKPQGQVSMEFPHLLRLLSGNQFDTIYHEHYSYLSLKVVDKIASSFGLEIIDVDEIPTHGGSLRVWLSHIGNNIKTKNVEKILHFEHIAGLDSLAAYLGFQRRAENVKINLLEFLINIRKNKKKILGYGAAAKGCTLLNYSGVDSDLLPAVADAALSKQGKFLPGSHIPIITPKEFHEQNCENVLILPWNLISELKFKLKSKKLFTAIPEIKQWT